MKSLKLALACLTLAAWSLQPALADAATCTADPTKRNATITTCLAGASADDVILLMPGEYLAEDLGGHETYPLQIKPGVSLIGYGPNSTKLVATGSMAMVGSSDGVRIQGMAIETDQTGIYLTDPSSAEGLEIRDCRITTGWTPGIGGGSIIKNNTTTVTVDNCEFNGTDWHLNVTEASVLKVSNSSFTGNAPGEAALSGRVGKLELSSISIQGLPDNFQFWADEVLMDDVDILNTFYVASPSNVLIRNSRIGYHGGGPVQVRAGSSGNEVKIVDTMLYGGLATNSSPYVILKDCYDENLNPVTVGP